MMDLKAFKQEAQSHKKRTKQTLASLSLLKKDETDFHFHEEHDRVFEEIDCLKCANCCKTTGPLFLNKDIDRLANHLKMKSSKFVTTYLRIDEDGDYVLKSTPCPFLGEDNYCSVYENRPKACREYPHTDRRNMQEIADLTYENTLMCPAAYAIVTRIGQRLYGK